MRLTLQKKLAAQILKCSKHRIWIDPEELSEVGQAITKEDIQSLINQGIVRKKQPQSQSRGRARVNLVQKRKGRHKGSGVKKGKKTARLPKKQAWIQRIRPQRRLLRTLRDEEKIDTGTYRTLVMKAKGGFFRSRRHINLYIEEHKLTK